MKNDLGKQLRGDSDNPFHLSVGQVLVNDEGKIALLKKSGGDYTLPRETIYLNESLNDCLIRGAREELGKVVEVIKFIGSQVTFFNREDGTQVEKTTLYFQTRVVGETDLKQENDEIGDELVWVDLKLAVEKLKKSENVESDIINRMIKT